MHRSRAAARRADRSGWRSGCGSRFWCSRLEGSGGGIPGGPGQSTGSAVGKLLVFAGILLVCAGAVLWVLEALLGGRGGLLPGDIVFRRGNVTFFFPIVTSIALSILLSLILYLLLGGRR